MPARRNTDAQGPGGHGRPAPAGMFCDARRRQPSVRPPSAGALSTSAGVSSAGASSAFLPRPFRRAGFTPPAARTRGPDNGGRTGRVSTAAPGRTKSGVRRSVCSRRPTLSRRRLQLFSRSSLITINTYSTEKPKMQAPIRRNSGDWGLWELANCPENREEAVSPTDGHPSDPPPGWR